MDPKQEEKSTVNGYIFGSEADVKLADEELTAIRYIDKKLENKNAETIRAVYNASIDKRMFRTPVGYSYLHDLQKRMLSMGVKKEEVRGIPLYQIYVSSEEEEKPPRVIKVKKPKDKYKRTNTILTWVNILLLLLIAIMFAISLSGSSTTVLNYRHNVENEYAAWEQDLTERENALKEKERELILQETGNELD